MSTEVKTGTIVQLNICSGKGICVMFRKSTDEGSNMSAATNVIMHQPNWNQGPDAQAFAGPRRIAAQHKVHL